MRMANPDSKPRPLAGVRVLDLTNVVMGPMATRIMGDLGAEVVKVEPVEGDFMRDFVPQRSEGMSGFTLNLNRNKRSIVLDLKSAAGRQAILDLAATSDVFVTNMRTAAIERLGISYDDIREVAPAIVYVSANGFGSDGPYAAKPAYDDVIQAASGLASMFAWLGDEPAYMPSIIADKVTGLHIAYATMAALYRKAITGEGDYVEVPMAETLAAFNLVEHLNGHTFEPSQDPFSYQRLMTKHRRPRRTADGWICVLPYTNKNYRDFFLLMERPDLADDPRFNGVNVRIDNVDALYGILDEMIQTKSTAEWLELCDEHSIPSAPVVDLEHIGDDPHFDAVGLLEVQQHPSEGAYKVVKDPVMFQSSQSVVRRHAPRLGQHTEEVLAELGYTSEQIAAARPEKLDGQ